MEPSYAAISMASYTEAVPSVGPMDGWMDGWNREMEGFLKGEVVEVVTYIMVGHVFWGGRWIL